MERPENRPENLEAAKARFLEEAGRLTPSAWIREHPELAVGGALAAGFFLGCTPEAQEATIRNASTGIRLVRELLERMGRLPGGTDEPKA